MPPLCSACEQARARRTQWQRIDKIQIYVDIFTARKWWIYILWRVQHDLMSFFCSFHSLYLEGNESLVIRVLYNVWLDYLFVVFALLPAKYWVISIHRRWNCSWKRFCSTESKWMDGPLTTAEAVTKMTSNCSIEIHNAEQSHCGNFEKLL